MYTPQNTLVFVTAMAGSMSGIAVAGRPIESSNAQDYLDQANISLAFCEEFDTIWGANQPDTFEVLGILEGCSDYWRDRDPQSLVPTTYAVEVEAIIAAIKEARAVIIAQGISIPAWGGGGGSGNATEFQGVPIASTTAANHEVYVVNPAGNFFDLRQLTQDDILPGFAITSFLGSQTVEIGANIVNPAFTANYTETPVSAAITNTDGIDSPLNLVSPFTAGTVVGTFHKTVQAEVDFTLTAIGSTTKTAGQSLFWEPRTFGGVGTAGATSATASGNSAILNGGDGTLASEGLFGSIVGQSFGPFNPSSQNIYILTQHTATPHTFKDQNGFGFAMNAPVTFNFTNQNGSVISYDLYQSTNVLASAFTVTVVN